MDHKAALLLTTLELMGYRVPHARDLHFARAQAIIRIIVAEDATIRRARPAHAPRLTLELVPAVIRVESSFRSRILGDHGSSVGLMQIHRGGRAWELEAAALGREPELAEFLDERRNIRAGIRLLYDAIDECGPDPERFLSRYNGLACGPSRYAQRVAALIRGHKLLAEAER